MPFADRPVAIAFVGSRKVSRQHMTIGDLQCARNIHAWLMDRGVKSLFLYESWPRHHPDTVDPRWARPSDFSAFVYSCGPLIGVENIFRKFSTIPRIAVNVSEVPLGNSALFFDCIVWRDSRNRNTFDVAIDPRFALPPINEERRIGVHVCLVGAQNEYGIGATPKDAFQELVLKTISRLGIATPHFIDTRIAHITDALADAEAPFGKAALVITNRLHGSLYSLRNGTPFIAIDQVRHGAKVKRIVADELGWPCTHLLETCSYDILARSIERCQKMALDEIASFRSKAEARAGIALDTVGNEILEFIKRQKWR